MTTAHFLFLRASEFVVTDSSCSPLCIRDANIHMTSTGEENLALHIKQSKTDQKGRGVLSYTGHSSHAVYAACAVKSNLHLQKQRSDWVASDPLFRLTSGSAMTRRNLADFVSSLLRLLGMDPQFYSGHSFRIGGAISASVAGLNDYENKLIGRWSSDCYKRYIRSPVSLFLKIVRQISSTSSTPYQYAHPFLPNS